MKTYIYKSLASVCLLLAGASCSGMLDDINPKDKIDSSQLTDDDLSKVVNGVYATMESHLNNAWWDGDTKGENFRSGPGGNLTDPHDMDPASTTVSSRWNNILTSLKQVNFLVETFEANPESTSSVFRTAGGTAYFFRALLYYDMVVRWGKAPILERRSYDKVPLSPEEDVWAFIFSDLTKAEELLPEFSDRFYVSKAACNALQARAYLFHKDYVKAAEAADKVISNHSFRFNATSETWARNFTYNSNSPELILALANKRTSSTILFYQYINDVDGSWNYSASHEAYASLYANSTYGTADIRARAMFNTDATRILKFPNGQDGQFVTDENPSQNPIPVFRLPEMYLIKAEALGASTGMTTLSEYMQNRYASVSLPASMDATAYQNLILDERHREFYAEGMRWFDIKRTGRLDLLTTLNGRTYLMYWPIPQSQIDLAGSDLYPQNPGYGGN